MISDLLCFLLEEEYGKLAKVLYGIAVKREIRMYIHTHGTPLSTIERSVRRTVAPKVAGRPGDVRSATTVAERRPSVLRRPEWNGDFEPSLNRV